MKRCERFSRLFLSTILTLTVGAASAHAAGTYTDLHDFGGSIVNADGSTGPDGGSSNSRVTVDAAGNLYGTTPSGGPFGGGILWKLTPAGVYTDLHDFGGTITPDGVDPIVDGYSPHAPITITNSGSMYGTTQNGGVNGNGIVWEITAAGDYLDLHDFGGTVTNADSSTGQDGIASQSSVTIDSSGNLYGTAQAGGEFSHGMVWEITADGEYRDLHDFAGLDGATPQGGVKLDGAGNIYGTTSQGGVNSPDLSSVGGVLWEITTAGDFEDLHDFGGTTVNSNDLSGADGAGPIGDLTFDAAGNLYGATLGGGGAAQTIFIWWAGSMTTGGMVWELSSTRVYSDLHDFGGNLTSPTGATYVDGFYPFDGVTLDTSGNIYGTASWGGANQFAGIVWKIDATGAYKILHDFGGNATTTNGTLVEDGSSPLAGVAIDASGNLYGNTQFTVPSGSGSIWKITGTPVPGPVAPPTNLKAQAGDNQVTLSWDINWGADTYNVYRSTSSTGTKALYQSGIVDTFFVDTGAANGVKYYYQVASVTALGTSSLSHGASATPEPPAPAAPTNLTASGGHGQVTLAWTASDGATSYNVYRSTSSTGTKTLTQSGVTGTSYVDTGVVNGTKYYYQLTAVNGGGSSPLSHGASATPQVAAPLPPTGLTATAGNAQVTLAWTASAGATSYNVYRSTSSTGAKALTQAGVTGVSFVDTDVVNGTKYYYQLAAVNAGGMSALSHGASSTPAP